MIANLTTAEWAALCAAVDDHRQHLVDNEATDRRMAREMAALDRAIEKVRQLAPNG